MRRGTTGDSEASLLRVLAAVDDPEAMGAMLKEVLTDAEYRALCRRWTILKRLREGHTQRAVAAEIGGSLCNVTRGAKILRNPRSIAARLLAGESEPGNSGPEIPEIPEFPGGTGNKTKHQPGKGLGRKKK